MSRTPRTVAYLAHPVSAPTQAGIEANLASARAWLKFLVNVTPWAISCPWMPYVEALTPEATYRQRGLADDLVMLERHDAIVLTGGRVSAGMQMEREHAAAHGLRVVDLTYIPSPPESWGSTVSHIIEVLGGVA